MHLDRSDSMEEPALDTESSIEPKGAAKSGTSRLYVEAESIPRRRREIETRIKGSCLHSSATKEKKMFAGKVDWIVPSGAAIQREVGDSSSSGNNSEMAFARVYAEVLDLSDEQCSEIGVSNGGLDTIVDTEELLATYDSSGLHAATNMGLGAGERHANGTDRDAGLNLSYFGVRYSGSSMDRLTSQAREAQFGSGPSQGAKLQAAVANTDAERNENSVQPARSGGDLALPSNSAEALNKTQLSTWMDAHALSRSSHHCAMYCRLGLEAGGISTEDRPRSGDAGDYGPFLLRHGAQTVPQDSYVPQVGDVVVFDKTDQHPYGHIEMYDGHHWVSDFMQHSFSPYHDEVSTPTFTIYRLA